MNRICAFGFVGMLLAIGCPLLFLLQDGFGECLKKREFGIEDSHFKCAFINLHALWVTALGKRECQGVYKLSDGDLTMPAGTINVENCASAFYACRKMLKRYKIPFVHIQPPFKWQSAEDLMALPDLSADAVAADEIVSVLKRDEFNVFDTRPFCRERMESGERVFFRTDHHWNFETCFSLYPHIVKYICRILNCRADKWQKCVRSSAWERIVAKRTWLGSYGRRAGWTFGGSDELVYYLPRFSANVEFGDLSGKVIRRGDFRRSVFRATRLDKPPFDLHDNAYCIYGEGTTSRRYFNGKAPVRKRLLIVKDSLAVPIVAFMSTVFREIRTLDMRDKACPKLETVVKAYHPDLVVMLGGAWNLKKEKIFE